MDWLQDWFELILELLNIWHLEKNSSGNRLDVGGNMI
jgi:hypothetical protein